MTEFEQVLEQCLDALEGGASNVDQCLARHPEHAAQLKPILLIAAGLEQGRAMEPSAAFKARARAKLTLHMQAHPRRSARPARSGFAFWRLGTTSLAMILLALLATGTVYAQSALPGDLFYEWKLLSERAWRAVSPDPVRTDLLIANRRIDELNAVAADPVSHALALAGYHEVLARLRSELDAETLDQILPPIDVVPEPIETTLPSKPTAVSIPTLSTEGVVPTQLEVINTPLPGVPEVIRTARPEIVPTIEIPPLLP